WIAAVLNLGAASISYLELARVRSGDWYALGWDVRGANAPGAVRKIVALAGHVLKKDFFILLCFCLALAGVLPYALPALAVGSATAFGGAVVRIVRRIL